MSQPFIGEIRPFGFNFPPIGWALCDGSLQSIAEYEALFVVIGTTYGGDGQSTFGLPDLRGRMPVHRGNTIQIGQQAGVESVSLLTSHLPPHSHGVMASADLAGATTPAGNVPGAKPRGGVDAYAAATALTPLAAGGVSTAGSSQAHDNLQPSLVMNFCISLYGIFPSRS
jgi:microcystin-dependent protein